MDHSSAPASPFDYLNQPNICRDLPNMEDPSVVPLREEVSLEWDNLIDLRAEPIHSHGSKIFRRDPVPR
jgi:hypothetical protein